MESCSPSERVILVNAQNRNVGYAAKEAAHRSGQLHRAFSIFLVDDKSRLLLQRRHPTKYHSGGLWANSCCGHPRPGERTINAARRRLFEELGLRTDLRLAFKTRYRAEVSTIMTENELVYVYVGVLRGIPCPNPQEIEGLMTLDLPALAASAEQHPQRWAAWMRHYLLNHLDELAHAIERLRSISEKQYHRPRRAICPQSKCGLTKPKVPASKEHA